MRASPHSTKDLRDALIPGNSDVKVAVLAMDDNERRLSVSRCEVRFQIRANVLRDYQLATDFLNINQIDIVIVEHEYGLYGARSGENVLKLVRNTRMPVITTLHTVLSQPDVDQAAVMAGIVAESDRLVVMSQRAVEILTSVYKTPRHKISMIPHGIPDMPFADSVGFKPRFGLEGREVLMTFRTAVAWQGHRNGDSRAAKNRPRAQRCHLCGRREQFIRTF